MTIGCTRAGIAGQGRVTTTGAVATTLLDIPIPFKHSANVRVHVSGKSSAGYYYGARVDAVSRDGASATYVGSVKENHVHNVAGAGWVIASSASGDGLRIQVTGTAATVVEWTAVAYFDSCSVDVPIIAEWSTTDTTQSHQIAMTAGQSYYVDWGDGSFTAGVATGGWDVVAHNYAAAGSYHQRWMVEDPSQLSVLQASTNGLRGRVPTISALVALASCIFDSNAQLSGGLGDLSALTSLVALWLQASGLSEYTASALAATLDTFVAFNCNLPESAVDQILADFATGVAGRPAAGTIALGGTGNAPPSAAGLASKAAILAAKPGWTITHN